MADAKRKTSFELREHPKELLYLIILKAKRSGFLFKNFLDDYDSFTITSFDPVTGRMAFVLRNADQLRVVYDSIYLLFFDVPFARALFGDDWEAQLVALASAPDKLKYLTDNLLIDQLYA
ncbi:hypothetical protein [Flaviaesturariibacter amylovorans]|uniref:Uncharacterized protein n=1 Tax=Flaviaesturariibacter amylovorans TaxID=1084520 RepID=A0ABP8G8M0_9BACT